MTGDHLPENLDRWPSDPHQLLGIGEDADRRTVRRAYIRLIRRYKPEHHPRQFQRIREAYEVALRYSSYNEQMPDEAETANGELPQSFERPESSSHETGRRTLPLAGPTPEEQCEEIWRGACDGDLPTAYARLLSLREKYFAHEDICLRLYWLLTVSPDLHVGREPCDWLVESLRADGNAGRSYELYCRELADRPTEATLGRSRSLLAGNLRVGFLSGLAEHRWGALGRLQHWDQIVIDVAALRERWPVDESEVWANLLISAIDQLAWAEGDVIERARRSYRDELEHETQLHHALENALVRMDLLVEASGGWRMLRRHANNAPATWIDLLPLCWNGPRHELHRRLIAVLYDISKSPVTGLNRLDRMNHTSGAATELLTEAAESFWYETMTQRSTFLDEEAASEPVRLFFRQHPASYRRIRHPLLEFCLRETISPDIVGRVADDPTQGISTGAESVTDHVAVDAPLRCAYVAHRAFWG